MSIKVEPSKIIQRFASNKKVKKLFASKGVSLNRTALSFVNELDFLNKKDVTKVALEVIKNYKKRVKADSDQKDLIKKDPKLLIQRVQNEVVLQMTEKIKDSYAGEKYRWLPSDAEEPDPEHQLKYGKIFIVGQGEMPGDRIGCRCGMEILVDEKELNL